MTKLLWATDVHLDFLEDVGPTVVVDSFVRPLSDLKCDGLLLSGDISNSSYLTNHLKLLDAYLNFPVYFVLGNHDFYGGDFKGVRQAVREACSGSKRLRYLSNTGLVRLSEKTALLGHDGWYDAYYGDASTSPYVMSDWIRIDDFTAAGATSYMAFDRLTVDRSKAISIARKAASEASAYVETQALLASKTHENVVIVTHVPPFPVLNSDTRKPPDALPWYASRLMGDALRRVSSRAPNVRFEVFCGHVHDAVDLKITDNLYCHVGASDYGNPRVSGQISVP